MDTSQLVTEDFETEILELFNFEEEGKILIERIIQAEKRDLYIKKTEEEIYNHLKEWWKDFISQDLDKLEQDWYGKREAYLLLMVAYLECRRAKLEARQ